MKLEEAFEASEEALRAGLAEAEGELQRIDVRRAELVALIERAIAALGDVTGSSESENLTLQRAMEEVLLTRSAYEAQVKDVAAEINERRLYRMRDGRSVEVSQVHARANNYKHLFSKNGSLLQLKYLFETTPEVTAGGYERAVTRVVRISDDALMNFETRVSYSVRIPANQTIQGYAVSVADERARRMIATNGFVPGAKDAALLTTAGWQGV